MPTYDYNCPSCNAVKEHIHRITEDPEYRCDKCGILMERVISLNATGFIMKYGSPAIHYREKQQRIKNSEKMEKKQRERWSGSGPQVAPNVGGMRTDSWADAKKLAKEAGMDHKSYDPYVKKEKKIIH